MKTSLFLLASAALQALAAPASSSTPKMTVKRSLVADSLANVYLDYGSEITTGKLSVYYGSCDDGSSTHEIGEFEVTEDFQPDKFSWYVPADAQDGCFYAKDASGNIIAQSEQKTISKRFSKRGHPELSDMYFNAIDYHKTKKISKRSNASKKDKSKYIY
jgi:hypothetical protein